MRDFKDLTISDNFIFSWVMRKEENAKAFLEALLGKRISKVVFTDAEESYKDGLSVHGIRLDVYVEDGEGTVYDIEMQALEQKGIEKRVRFYQSGIDRKILEVGKDYTELRDSFIIFICTYDPFDKGLAVYEKESKLKSTDLPYEDGSHAFILNANYKVANGSKELIEFLDFVRETRNGRTPDIQTDWVKKISADVEAVKNDSEMEERYMTLAMMIRDERTEARMEEAFLLISAMLENGMDIPTISKVTNLSEDEIQDILDFDDENRSESKE